MAMNFTTLQEKPEMLRQILELHKEAWPRFMWENLHRHSNRIADEMPHLQIIAHDINDGIVAVGHTVTIAWDWASEKIPAGYDKAIDRAFEDVDRGENPTCLVAIAAATKKEHLGKGIGKTMIIAMKNKAREQGLSRMIGPVRPTWKAKYPLTPMHRYVQWKEQDGFSFDPWLRVHQECGAEIVETCNESMKISGTVLQWEQWTGMRFFESGEYVVRGTLCPVSIDCEKDVGIYREPNVWVSYNIK